MSNTIRAACFLLGLWLLSSGIYGQEEGAGGGSLSESQGESRSQSQTIPDALRRPERGEAPRYPQDLVIGALGQGDAPTGAYDFARNLLSALTTGSKNASVLKESSGVLNDSHFEEIAGISPRSYRIGGGRTEPDDCVSFMVRFLGQEESITGELFVRLADSPGPAQPKPPETADETQTETPADVPAETPAVLPSPLRGAGPNAEKWILDDLILEEKRALTEIRDSYRFDFSPYERFY